MIHQVRLVTLSLALLFLTCSISLPRSTQEIAKKALDATVLLTIESTKGEISTGSGFLVQQNLIVTNFHLIDGFARGVAHRNGQKTAYPIKRVQVKDEKHDLAILQISTVGVEPLPIGDSESVRIGDRIFFSGNSIGVLKSTFSDGLITVIREVDGVKKFQAVGPISIGKNGGPVLNANGEVIGVSSGSAPLGQKIQFVIPSIYLKALVNQSGGEKKIVRKVATPPSPKPPLSSHEMIEKGIELSISELAQRAIAATVSVEVQDENGTKIGRGSGFFVRRNLIATNFHVIDGAAGGGARLIGQNTIYPIQRICAVDEKHDLAILEVSAPGIEPLPIGDSESVAVGAKIYVAGASPVDFDAVFSDGLISAISEIEARKLFLITASIVEGNSGVPVLNVNGEMIGVAFPSAPFGQNVHFAIPSIYLKSLVDRLSVEKKSAPKVATPISPKPSPQDVHKRRTELSAPELVQRALAATVSVEVEDENGTKLGRGSGFFVRRNLVATNFHVIDGAARASVKLVNTETKYRVEGVTASDETNDLALLKVAMYGVTPLPLGNSDMVQITESVYVVGNPKDFEGTVSDGIISGRRDKGGKERLQMTAPISPGSSGGPVLNQMGEVIGVSVSLYNPLFAQNLNFAIPSNTLRALLKRSKSAKPLRTNNRFIR